MDNLEEKPKIELEYETLKDLDKTRKWTMFLAILGFIGIGALLIVGIITGIFLSVFNKGDTASSYPGWLACVIIISASAIYFFPLLYMFRFSRFIASVAKTKSTEELKKAFKNLRSYFTYIGILVIVLLVIYVVAFLALGSSFNFLKDIG
jgi:Na+/melibiose symporter-like transporter